MKLFGKTHMPVGTLTKTVHPKHCDSWNQYLNDIMAHDITIKYFLPKGILQGVKRDFKEYESF